MGKVIVVASGKGGTGKTTAVGALASCLAALGHKTLCIDCDIGMRNLDVTIGMSSFAVNDMSDVLSGDMPLQEACTQHPNINGLYFLSAPPSMSPEDIDRCAFLNMIDSIRQEFEYCLIDAPAGIGQGFRLAACGSDMGLIVTTGDVSSMRDGQKAALLLRQSGLTDLRLIVNRVRPRHYRKLRTTIDETIDTVSVRLIGVVYEDEGVIISANSEIPLILYERKGAAKQFLRIAERITGAEIPLFAGRKAL
jgi:septum site-determining protein MinD